MTARKILYIVSHWSGAPEYGAQQRVQQVGRLLNKVGHVNMVVLNNEGAGEQWRAATEAEFNIARVINVQPIESRGVLERLQHEFDSRYLRTVPSVISPADRQAVLSLSSQHDVVWIHTIRTANTLGIYRWSHSVLDIDDIPSRFYESAAINEPNLRRRLIDWRMSYIWRRREKRLGERFDVLTVCSESDRRYLSTDRAYVLPNGFRSLSKVERCPSKPPRIGFIGTFQWQPNVEGVRWFCHSVWPVIKGQISGARLRVVGEGTEMASQWGEDVDGLGRIQDVGNEIATWSVMIVPIRIGGGTRIKVLEAFARRCPVVATKLGAFGYDIHDGQELLLADDHAVFASRCLEVIESSKLAEALVDRAHQKFLKSWTWESYESVVGSAVQRVCEQARHSGASGFSPGVG